MTAFTLERAGHLRERAARPEFLRRYSLDAFARVSELERAAFRRKRAHASVSGRVRFSADHGQNACARRRLGAEPRRGEGPGGPRDREQLARRDDDEEYEEGRQA